MKTRIQNLQIIPGEVKTESNMYNQTTTFYAWVNIHYFDRV